MTEDYILDEDKRFDEAAEKASILLALHWDEDSSLRMLDLRSQIFIEKTWYKISDLHWGTWSQISDLHWGNLISDHAAGAKGDLPAECQQCQQLRHLQVSSFSHAEKFYKPHKFIKQLAIPTAVATCKSTVNLQVNCYLIFKRSI